MRLADFTRQADARDCRTLIRLPSTRGKHFYFFEVSKDTYEGVNSDNRIAFVSNSEPLFFVRIFTEEIKNFLSKSSWYELSLDSGDLVEAAKLPAKFVGSQSSRPHRLVNPLNVSADFYSQEVVSSTPVGRLQSANDESRIVFDTVSSTGHRSSVDSAVSLPCQGSEVQSPALSYAAFIMPTEIEKARAVNQLLIGKGYNGIQFSSQGASQAPPGADKVSAYARILSTIENLKNCTTWNACALAEGYPAVLPVGCKIQSAAPELFTEELVNELNEELTNCAMRLTKKLLLAQGAMLIKLAEEKEAFESSWQPREEDKARLQNEYSMRLHKKRTYERRPLREKPIEFFIPPDLTKANKFIAFKSNPLGLGVALKLPADSSGQGAVAEGISAQPQRQQYRPSHRYAGSRPYYSNNGRGHYGRGKSNVHMNRFSDRHYDDDRFYEEDRNYRFNQAGQQQQRPAAPVTAHQPHQTHQDMERRWEAAGSS